MAQPESKLSRKIMDALREEGAFAFKVHGSEHMMAGLPDIICCYRGSFFGFETKMSGKRDNVSLRQERVGSMIKEAGGAWYVVCSPEEALGVIHSYFDVEKGNTDDQ